ncbi:MAG: hypothetical protein AAGI03_05340 [Pseudomonadota bacterium]
MKLWTVWLTLISLVGAFAFPATAQSPGEERVLGRVFVSAPAPHLGALHVRPVVATGDDEEVEAVELVFAPVDYADGVVTPASNTNQSDRHLIGAVVPTRQMRRERSEEGVAGDTQSIYLPNGYYVISQVRYRYGDSVGESEVFCLSERSFVFRVGMMETVFMGRLPLVDPRIAPTNEAFTPIALPQEGARALRGWRKGGGQVTTFRADPVSFTPTPSMCPPESVHTAGWIEATLN